MDQPEERWLSAREAARAANRDPRTIRRWIDAGKVRGRISPGGHYQVEASSLLNAHRVTNNGRSSGGDRTTPVQDLIPTWAEVSIDWYGWTPPRHLSDAALEEIQSSLRELTRALGRLDDAVTDELRSRYAAAEPEPGWLSDLS